MQLSHNEVEQFYRIWFPLLHFVNQKLKIVDYFPDSWGDRSVDTQVAQVIRDAMWEEETNALLFEFIEANPNQLATSDLEIARSWQHRISSNFFIFRYLKKHTIFLNEGEPDRAYGVHGLVSSFEEMLGDMLPIYVQAVLIPFKDTIIYDSLLFGHPIMFGSGIKSSLNDIYRAVREREGVITQLPFDESKIPKAQINKSNTTLIKAFRQQLAGSGLSENKTNEHSAVITAFVDDFLVDSSSPFLLDVDKQLIEAYINTRKVNIVSFTRFIRFMRDTYRMYYDDAQDIIQYLRTL